MIAMVEDRGDEPIKEDVLYPPVDVASALNERDINLVQQTWERASRLGVETVGKVVFMQIFNRSPGTKYLFPFGFDSPDEMYAVGSKLCQHATKVVNTLAIAVSLLREMDRLGPILVELGLRHVDYAVMPWHYDIVTEAVLGSLAIALGERYTPAVKNAWIKILQTVKVVMIGINYDEQFKEDVLYPPVDVNAPLKGRDIKLVQQTWERASRLGAETVGKVVFMQIFKLAPEAIELFPFKYDSPDQLYAVGSKLCLHATKVVNTLATAVSLLNELGSLEPVLKELGLKHLDYGVSLAHYDIVAEAVLNSLAIALGEKNTPAVKNSWTKVLKFVKATMAGTNYDDPVTEDLLHPPVDVTSALNERDIRLVQQTWERTSRLGSETVGKVVFMQIFKLAPGAVQLFPFRDDSPELLYAIGSKLCQHANKVVCTLATAVSLLNDLDTLLPVLKELGLKHVSYSVMPAHYDIVNEAIHKSLAVALGDKYTVAVKNSWTKVLETVKAVMIGSNYDVAPQIMPAQNEDVTDFEKMGPVSDTQKQKEDMKMPECGGCGDIPNAVAQPAKKKVEIDVVPKLETPGEQQTPGKRYEAWMTLDKETQEKLGSRLIGAAKSGNVCDLKCVLEENCDPDHGDHNGTTGLHYAAGSGHIDVVKTLLEYGASPLVKVKVGECGLHPLHCAAREGHIEVAKLVFDVKAMTAENSLKKTPVEIAQDKGFNELAATLKKMQKAGTPKLHQRFFRFFKR